MESTRHELAFFESRDVANAAVFALIGDGVAPGSISMFERTAGEAADQTGAQIDAAIEVGGEAGAETGAVAGFAGGLLIGLGLLTIPGIGPILAAGPLATALTLAITGGAVGGFAGSLIGLGVSEVQSIAAQHHLKAGRTLVAVRCAGSREDVRALLALHGATFLTDG